MNLLPYNTSLIMPPLKLDTTMSQGQLLMGGGGPYKETLMNWRKLRIHLIGVTLIVYHEMLTF